MKKVGYALVIITAAFCLITFGILIGKNMNHSDITTLNTTDVSSSPVATESAPRKININTATEEELTLLPGIGPVLAKRIIEYRTNIGPFLTETDLGNVKGIGDQKLLKLLDYITV